MKHSADNSTANTYYGVAVSGNGGVSSQLCSSSTYGLGYPALVLDEAGKKRQVWTDGFGKMIEADEPDNSGSLTMNTCYTYDLLGNLTQTSQGSQTRAYTYDGLSRVTAATTPETGNSTLYFYYTTSGGSLCSGNPSAVCRRTDPKGITTTYSYDALNRLTQKGYTAQTCTNGSMPSPVATYFYDQTSYNGLTITNGIGRRTGMSDAAGTEAWSYDVIGRPLTDRRTTNSVTKNTTYTYNLDGSVATLSYPSGRTITYTTGGAAWPLNAKDTPNSINYALSATYAPQGALGSLTNGGSLVSTLYYNSRLQPCRISVKSSGTAPAQCSDGTNVGNVLDFTYSFNLGSSDNGNVMGITNNRDTTRSESFTYDQLNRLATGQTSSTYSNSPAHCWGETFGYDQWGNFLNISVLSSSYNGCTQESLNVAVNAQNRMSSSGYVYDTAGNMTNMLNPGGMTAQYNAENQLTNANAVTYTYDGDGKRVQKSNGKLYWYGIGSDPLDETDSGGNPTSEYVFFGGKRIARLDWPNPNTSVYYYFEDHLGSSRVITNATASICYDADFYPFGGERTPIVNACQQNYKFTGKERDGTPATETGLDNFGARYGSSTVGRFMSVDPSRVSINPINPQSWNRYTYALDNPLSYVDRTGLWPTSVHDEIYEAIFRGHLTSHQIAVIERKSAQVDSVFKGGQSANKANWHAQCTPSQSVAECETAITNHINRYLELASSASGRVGGLSDEALGYYAVAAHASADKGSPSHHDASGTPTTWGGIRSPLAWPGDIAHVWSERDEALDWYGIGQSVRNDVNNYYTAFGPEIFQETFHATPDEVSQTAIETIVRDYFAVPTYSNSSIRKEELARQCALGNRAACD